MVEENLLLHGSLAHGEGDDVFTLEELRDSFSGELESDTAAFAAGEGEDFFCSEEGRVGGGLLFGYAGKRAEESREDGHEIWIGHRCGFRSMRSRLFESIVLREASMIYKTPEIL
jgi:hypothetical protein